MTTDNTEDELGNLATLVLGAGTTFYLWLRIDGRVVLLAIRTVKSWAAVP